MQINVIKATVLVRPHFTDYIYLDTDLPSSVEKYPTTLRCEQPKGTGADWVRKQFNIEPEVIGNFAED